MLLKICGRLLAFRGRRVGRAESPSLADTRRVLDTHDVARRVEAGQTGLEGDLTDELTEHHWRVVGLHDRSLKRNVFRQAGERVAVGVEAHHDARRTRLAHLIRDREVHRVLLAGDTGLRRDLAADVARLARERDWGEVGICNCNRTRGWRRLLRVRLLAGGLARGRVLASHRVVPVRSDDVADHDRRQDEQDRSDHRERDDAEAATVAVVQAADGRAHASASTPAAAAKGRADPIERVALRRLEVWLVADRSRRR
ncbi:hypothetical protein ACFPRL_14655 [Pseudoclavibacter helvolus]